MARATDGRVRYVVRYEDGTTAIISVDTDVAQRGENRVLDDAYQRQRAGSLPAGKIKSVEPA